MIIAAKCLHTENENHSDWNNIRNSENAYNRFLKKNANRWWRAKLRNFKNAYDYFRLLMMMIMMRIMMMTMMMMMMTIVVVPSLTSKFWSWWGPRQHFRMGQNGGHMSECLGQSEFWARWNYRSILCHHKLQECGILSLVGATATFSHEGSWGHTRQNLVQANWY